MKRFQIIILFFALNIISAQNIYRYGSTAVNFLEIGVGSANAAMGDAGVTFADGAIDVNIASHDGSNGLKLGGTLVTATAADINGASTIGKQIAMAIVF